jgi:hypothetical protein
VAGRREFGVEGGQGVPDGLQPGERAAVRVPGADVLDPRPTIDFSSQALIVVVDAVRACRAEYVPTSLENGRLVLQFVQEGACPYDLVVFYAGTLTRSAGEIQVMVSGA